MTKVRAILRRRWPILVIAALMGIAAGVASSALDSDSGEIRFVAEQVVVANRVDGSPGDVAQDSLKVTRGNVPNAAAEALGSTYPPDELVDRLDVTFDEGSGSITLRADDPDPQVASNIVQAFSAGFLDVVNTELRSEDLRQIEQVEARVGEAEAALAAFDEENGMIVRQDVPLPQTPALDALVAERQRLQEALAEAERRLLEVELEVGQREPYATLGMETPRVAESRLVAVPSSTAFRGALLGVIGLLLGAGLVALLERLNRRVDTRDELAGLINVPILAEVGRVAEKERAGENGQVALDGRWAEHYRRVRSAIQFVQAESTATGAQVGPTSQQAGAVIAGHGSGHGSRVFLFASAMPGEGKSTSTALTALALAETGDDTLVINADFRRPMLEKYLGAETSPSLQDLAELRPDRPSVDEIVQATAAEHLWLAAAGPPTLEVKGRLQATRELATEAASRGGTVLIDSAPLWVTNDPIDLLPVVDEVILVVRAGRTTTKSLLDTLQMLDMHHAPVLGVILIGTVSSHEMYGYYGSYYDAAATADRTQRAVPSPPSHASRVPAAPAAPVNEPDRVGSVSAAPQPGASAAQPAIHVAEAPVAAAAQPAPTPAAPSAAQATVAAASRPAVTQPPANGSAPPTYRGPFATEERDGEVELAANPFDS